MSLKSSPLVEGFASFLLLFALALLLESDNSFLPNIIPITPLDSTLTLFSLIAKFQTVSCVLRHSNGCYHMCCPLSICILRTETNLIFPCIALNWGTPTKKKPRFPSHQGEEIFYLWGLNSSGMQEVTEEFLSGLAVALHGLIPPSSGKHWKCSSVQFNRVDPRDCSMPGLPVHHQLPEFTQTHVHWVGDAIPPSHPLSSPSPPTFNLSQHQGLFKWVSSSHQVASVLEFQLQHQSFQWIFRIDFL